MENDELPEGPCPPLEEENEDNLLMKETDADYTADEKDEDA